MPDGFQIPTDQPFDVDTFNRTLSTLIQMRRQQEESEAAANRYLGQQQYRQLIETGTQPEEALRKTAHLLFYDQPSALPGVMRVTAPRPEGFWTETPEGVPVWQRPSGGLQFQPRPAAERLSPEQKTQIDVVDDNITQLRKDAAKFLKSNALEGAPPSEWKPEEITQYQSLTNSIAQLEAQKIALVSGQPTPPPPAQTGTRVKRKSDGKIFLYKGKREDIPTDQYDIL